MRSTDAFSWNMERDPALRSTVVTVFWLDKAPDWDTLVHRLDRVSRQMVSLRQRVVEPPLHLATPRWIVDPHFDLSWHLRRVAAPAPGSRDTVLDMARQSAMDAFDRQRPLWELTLVEALEGGAAAVILKMHHSLTDGVGGISRLTILFDLSRAPDDLGPLPSEPVGEHVDGLDLVTGAAGSVIGQFGHRALRGAEAAVPALVHTVRHPVRTVRDAAALAGSVYRLAAPVSDTMSPVMVERAMTRHLATMEVPLEPLRQASRNVGVTLNAAFLAAVTGALRRYHERHGSTVESLRVVMPINLRSEQDREWGNRITLQRVTLPVSEPDPAVRMRLVLAATKTAREELSLPYTDVVAEGLNLLPTAYVGGMLKHIDFLASNVPGSPAPIYLGGAKVTGFFAFGPTIGTAFNVTLVSHESICDLGINIDTTAVPDPETLLECLQESFEEILSLAG
ncbi:MAG: wax ester/triacylglycerol synthase domain-containing protein [Nocardioidaceae bacterium]